MQQRAYDDGPYFKMISNQVFFQTDAAWDFLPGTGQPSLPLVDVREEARGLRFVSTPSRIEAFAARHAGDFRPFTLYGSGDFHHLSGVWTRQFREPFTLLSFDNHPDWDVRPPKWSCGAWINRALENPLVEDVGIWGCGNFECAFPARLLGNRRAAKTRRLLIFPWKTEDAWQPAYFNPITPKTWKTQFLNWVENRHDKKIYVTIDMDCLSSSESVTNWENGRFTCDDLIWALQTLRGNAEIIGGDLCGAWSQPAYETTFQKFAGWFDHPKISPPDAELRHERNGRVFEMLWPALTGS